MKQKKITKKLSLPGEVFSIGGCTAFLIMPEHPVSVNSTPWIWYGPTLSDLPAAEEKLMFKEFLDAGIAVAGIDVGESFGAPPGRVVFSAFYNELVTKRGFSKKPCLLARSRGGLQLYNWAVENPLFVTCVAGIYPVCNLASYPGIKKACIAYGMTESQLKAKLAEHNPINRIEALAKAHVPIYHIHGDSDTLVPLEDNSVELAKRYRKLGGIMTLNVIKGQGHNTWSGWFQCRELIDFVIAQAIKVNPDKLNEIKVDMDVK